MLSKIKQYSSIVLFTHTRPDMDALGSQLGLKSILKQNFPEKRIYAVGERNKFDFNYDLDEISDEIIKDSLIIVLDSGGAHLISDSRYSSGDYIVKFDHHINKSPYGDLVIVDESAESTCGMVTEFAISNNLEISIKAAELLYAGLVTDSGRFLYSNVTTKTFSMASHLINIGIDIESIYKRIYVQSLSFKKLQGFVLSNFIVDGSIAYIIYNEEVLKEYNTNLAELKSGTVNQMANIEGIKVWATFTEFEGKVFLELRGRVDCLDIAIKYGGGGHLRACGATITKSEINQVIEEMKQL